MNNFIARLIENRRILVASSCLIQKTFQFSRQLIRPVKYLKSSYSKYLSSTKGFLPRSAYSLLSQLIGEPLSVVAPVSKNHNAIKSTTPRFNCYHLSSNSGYKTPVSMSRYFLKPINAPPKMGPSLSSKADFMTSIED
jgi:hypothetical protein